jgi:hypothetical protein
VGSGMSVESEFVRPEFLFEVEFGQFRNWWARDKRIAGNPFSILMYLVSHDRNFRVTQQSAMNELGFGRQAFIAARRRLEAAGFLRVDEHRLPRGAKDESGLPVGGHRMLIFTVLDPAKPATRQKALTNTGMQASVDFVPRLSESEPEPVDNSEPYAQNPTQGFVPLKEDQAKENQSSSDEPVAVVEAVDVVAASPEDEDDSGPLAVDVEPGLAKVLREVHSRLDASLLLSRLAKLGIDPLALNLELAASVAIFASPRPVGDPVAYLVGAIRREPYRWIKQPSGAGNEHWSPAVLSCDAGVHLYGTPRSDPWQMVCLRCGEERDGWREQRDADEASGRAAS